MSVAAMLRHEDESVLEPMRQALTSLGKQVGEMIAEQSRLSAQQSALQEKQHQLNEQHKDIVSKLDLTLDLLQKQCSSIDKLMARHFNNGK